MNSGICEANYKVITGRRHARNSGRRKFTRVTAGCRKSQNWAVNMLGLLSKSLTIPYHGLNRAIESNTPFLLDKEYIDITTHIFRFLTCFFASDGNGEANHFLIKYNDKFLVRVLLVRGF